MPPRFEEQRPAGVRTIQGYVPGGYRIGGETIVGAVLVTPESAAAWPVAGLDALSVADFDALSAADPKIEIVLIGTGATLARPGKPLLEALRQRGLSPEFMDSRAAARTYNVLVAEGRRVAAALLPV